MAVRRPLPPQRFRLVFPTPIARIKESLAEIKQVARKKPVLAAEGTITFLEKLSPTLE